MSTTKEVKPTKGDINALVFLREELHLTDESCGFHPAAPAEVARIMWDRRGKSIVGVPTTEDAFAARVKRLADNYGWFTKAAGIWVITSAGLSVYRAEMTRVRTRAAEEAQA